jgi:hypothetical protein
VGLVERALCRRQPADREQARTWWRSARPLELDDIFRIGLT